MSAVFDALPGVKLPVGKVTQALSDMWSEVDASEGTGFRASQMNLILHFGIKTTLREARERFDAAVRFAQRYPSRIIVLCPLEEAEDGNCLMRSKLFSQCYLGESLREMCCCEALILSYLPTNFGYLGNQVSVWLEGDLPTYFWVHRVPANRIREHYLPFFKMVKRVVFDSSIDGDSLGKVDWPTGCKVQDLARARTLPIRQSLGQFLSGFAPQALTKDLVEVRIEHCPAMIGEAEEVLRWTKACLAVCDERQTTVQFKREKSATDDCGELALRLDWKYGDGRFLCLCVQAGEGVAQLEYDFGHGAEEMLLRVKLFTPEQTLAEAFFFGH